MLFNEINKTQFTLDVIGAKQEALSTNLANINTPGYVRRDVNFEQYLGQNRPLETKLSQKLGSTAMPEKDKKVNLTEELAAMQRNNLYYTIAARRVSKVVQEIKTVTQLGR